MEKSDRIQSSRPVFEDAVMKNILQKIEQSLKEGTLTDGRNVKNFEASFAKYIQTKHAIAVNSGTSALEIALRHYELDGKEVIVPTNTFVATPNSVIFANGRPVFADMREDSLCIDPEDIKEKITSRTAGVIVVHIAGLVCPQIEEIKELCEDHKLFLLEDSAHAHGATINGDKAGKLGDAGCFSFYPTKVMTTGEGGMITTDDPKLAQTAYCIRSHGQDSRRLMVKLGHNWRMNEIAAILGNYQLENLEKFLHIRNEIAEKYNKKLSQIEGVSLFTPPKNIKHSYYKYPIKINNNIEEEKVTKILLQKYNIETGNVYYPPCHLHPYYKENFGTNEGDFPIAEKILKKVICLPIHINIKDSDIEYVSRSLEDAINLSRK
jgi:dTDP-4-amino-4,6-dideoxygalactose transaminase